MWEINQVRQNTTTSGSWILKWTYKLLNHGILSIVVLVSPVGFLEGFGRKLFPDSTLQKDRTSSAEKPVGKRFLQLCSDSLAVYPPYTCAVVGLAHHHQPASRRMLDCELEWKKNILSSFLYLMTVHYSLLVIISFQKCFMCKAC